MYRMLQKNIGINQDQKLTFFKGIQGTGLSKIITNNNKTKINNPHLSESTPLIVVSSAHLKVFNTENNNRNTK